MHLKLYIESSISVVLAFRARLVQLNRSDQRSHRSTLGSQNTIPSAGCWNIISVVMPRAREMSPPLAAAQTCRGVAALPPGTQHKRWLWRAGYSLWVQQLPHTQALLFIHICLLLSPLASLGPEGLGVQSSGNQAAGSETQCLPSLHSSAKEKLILGSLGHHELIWLCGCSFPTHKK